MLLVSAVTVDRRDRRVWRVVEVNLDQVVIVAALLRTVPNFLCLGRFASLDGSS